jgi:osmoprotectant transport system ATP-binding protein
MLITHDMTEALLLADRIAVMHEGRIVEANTPRALMLDTQHAYVRELMQTPRRQAERLSALMAEQRP